MSLFSEGALFVLGIAIEILGASCLVTNKQSECCEANRGNSCSLQKVSLGGIIS